MEKYIVIIVSLGAAMVIVGGLFCVYQLYMLVRTDADCRGLKHPKLWGIFAISGNGQSGLILYLIGRRKYPVINMTQEQSRSMEKNKKKFGVGLIFLILGAMICMCSMIILNP